MARPASSAPKSGKRKSEGVTTPAAAQAESAAVPAQRSAALAGSYRAKVRMYRHGLGDCFLVSLKRSTKGAADYRILIDCGVILGTLDAVNTMTGVVDNVVAETGGKIDLLIITHEHWDHLSGFIQAAESFEKIDTAQVWVAWTEDPADALAKSLRKEQAQALTALQRGVQALQAAGADEQAEMVGDLLGFFGAAGSGTTRDAFDRAKAMGPLRFCRPADKPVHLEDPNATFYILGPPPDLEAIRRTLPSKSRPETYGLSMDGNGVMGADVHAALLGDAAVKPFNDMSAIPFDIAKGLEFFSGRYWGPGEEAPPWRSISGDWLDSAADLALALDSATNNTSLVLAIELPGGDVLLFAADAQVGNWESWQNLSWEVGSRTVTGPGLLSRAIFYKVGHHGSHNATLKEGGLELMVNLEVAAIPVFHDMAVTKHWGNIPQPELVKRLTEITNGRLLRSDVTPPPMDGVLVDTLYFEMIF